MPSQHGPKELLGYIVLNECFGRLQSLKPTQPARLLQSLLRLLHLIMQVSQHLCPALTCHPGKYCICPLSLEEESIQVFKLISSLSLRCSGSECLAVSVSLACAQQEVI